MTGLLRTRRGARLVLAALFCSIGGTLLAVDTSQPLKVCLVSGSLEYKSNESLAAFQQYLEANYRAKCSRAFVEGTDEEHLPGLENLADCDVMLLFTRRLKLSGEQLERLKNYCQSGKPIVGVRTASHAIQTWLDLDKEVLGGNYHNHYGAGPETDIKIVDSAKSHPILAGVKPFRSAGSLYKNEGHAIDIDVLMTGAIPEHTEPIAWTRIYKGGRIFYTSLGHPQDFNEESFRRMLVNALFWTTGRTPEPKQQSALSAAAAPEIELKKDIVYGTGGGKNLLLDLAAPKGLDHPVPGIVWIHGGAWQGGHKGEFENLIRDSARAGYVAVSINYRLAPKHIFPAQIEDCKCAVRWLRASAESLHVDPSRIGVVGASAGAHLAMMLGAMDGADGLEGSGGSSEASSKPQVVVSYSGPTNLRSPYPEISNTLIATFLGGTPAEKPDAYRLASPITYINSGDAPMLLIQGTKDPLVPYEQAYQMAEALTKVGVPGRVELLLLAGHGWEKKDNARVTRATFEFLDRYLKP
ncbi:MAG: alpha/beta hydrolase fold domain-containing protein [Planctomycetia bacterium]|nr:alpha/beta hydrolase fold domain-containing protein [Planctomycetia bacterium]